MNREFYTDTRSIFGEKDRRVAVTIHNIGDLLRNASEDFRGGINNHYSARSGANNYAAEQIGALVSDPNVRLQEHGDYLRRLYQNDFKIYTPEDLKNLTESLQPGEPNPLIVPYFNSHNVERQAAELGADIWGLPAKLTETLKNKASFHDLVKEADIEGFEVPEYTIGSKYTYIQNSMDIINYSRNLYDRHGLGGRYPLGVMVRLEESDGNYGSSLVRQEEDGRISITPDGDSEKREFRTTWEDALTRSKDMIYENVDPDQEPRVVVSRYLDLVDSPGLSVVFINGKAHSLGWNGQLQLNGSKACVGTSSYHPEDPYLQQAQKDYEEQSAAALEAFVVTVAKNQGIDPRELNGAANVDNMVYGKLERELREKQGKPQGVYVAETNPRWTNYTDGIMAAIGATGRQPTISDMRSVIREGIYTEDKFKLDNAAPEIVREIIESYDSRNKENRVLVRMPDENEMGVIYLGDRKETRGELKQVVTVVNQLQRATNEEVTVFGK